MGRKRSAPPKIIVEYPVCDRPIDSVKVAHDFAADLKDNSVTKWCGEVRQAILESKTACSANDRSVVPAETNGRKATKQKRIRELQAELARLMEEVNEGREIGS